MKMIPFQFYGLIGTLWSPGQEYFESEQAGHKYIETKHLINLSNIHRIHCVYIDIIDI